MSETEGRAQTDPPPAFTPAAPGSSSHFGRYEIIGELAAGGMGIVYLARVAGEAGFQRLFALKIMHEHLARDADFVEMLLDEARLTSRLHHPNIVPILDLGKDQGRYYLAMDYIEGCSLAQLSMRYRNERDPRKLVPLMIDALEGLHAAHTALDEDEQPLNLVHRDVSPQNIMVGVDGVARVVDFGIAKAEARITSTRPGMLKGRIALLSPEQLRGSEVDARSDIFSAGAVLWSLLTGCRLFKADSESATITNILNMEVRRPSTVGLKPPPIFDIICLRALQRDPARRYQTASQMADDLRKVAMSRGLVAPRDEIAAWIRGSFKQEFAARREAVRQRAAVQEPGIPRLPSLGRDSISGSGIRASTTGSGSFSGIGAAEATASLPSLPLPVALPVSHTARSNKVAIVLGALGLTVAIAVGSVLMMSGREKPAEVSTAVRESTTAAPRSPEPAPAPAPRAVAPAPQPVVTPAPVQPAASEPRPSARRNSARLGGLAKPPPQPAPDPKTEAAFKPPDELAAPQ